MVRKVQGRENFRMQAAKRAVAKLQGGKTASFCWEIISNEWSRSYREINQLLSSMELFTHGYLDPSAFPENRVHTRGVMQ